MDQPRLDYLGPIGREGPSKRPKFLRKILQHVSVSFLLVVILPTVLAAIYYLLIAAPRYVSEAQFIVRSAAGTPSSLGVALQGVGLSNGATDAFAVHQYITSKAALADLKARNIDVERLISAPGLDFFGHYPMFGGKRSNESLNKARNRLLTVGYDSVTGLSTLRVQAYRPQDAKLIADALLEGGEGVVNALNDRAVTDAVSDARLAKTRAEEKLLQTQQHMTSFRRQNNFINAESSLAPNAQLLGSLMITRAQLRAERSQLAAGAPQSPGLEALDQRIAAIEAQIDEVQARISRGPESLAPQVGDYERLTFERELATREVSVATTALLAAEQEARRQALYLERVVNPDMPDSSTAPKRLLSILSVLAAALLVYGLGWLIVVGVREHKQG